MILPFIEQQALYDKFEFSEGSFGGNPNQEGPNKSVHALNRIDAFLCPSATRELAVHPSSTLADGRQTYASHYYGVGGPKGNDPAGNPYPFQEDPRACCGGFALGGVLYKSSRVRIADVVDGTSNTLAIGEIAWAEEGSHGVPAGGGDGANWVRGIAFGTTDAAVSGISSCKNVVDGINVMPVRFNDIPFSSRHPGGAQFAMGDGAVRFVSENVGLAVYKAAASRDGGEAGSLP
jgi:prepilin-type processing-associated H-X9-DG protein